MRCHNSTANGEPRQQHWNAAMHVLRYLQGSKSSGIVYKKTAADLHAYTDASWAIDYNDRKSQSGFASICGGGTVLWRSKKQTIVTTSSTEAEYVNLSSVAKEAAFLHNGQ